MNERDTEVWAFSPGRRVAHAVAPYTLDPVARCGVRVVAARQVSTYDPAHVGIGPCRRCGRGGQTVVQR